MKKLLVVLLVLTAFAGFAFADAAVAAPALVLSGSLDTGVKIFGDTALNFTGKIYESNNGDPSDFWFDATFAGTSAGAFFEMYAADLTTEIVKTDSLYAWWKPISMVKISAGQSYGDVYSSPYEGWDNGSTGFQISITPIEGLVAAVDYPFTTSSTAAGLTYKNLKVAAGYTLAGIATVGTNDDFGTQTYIFGVNITAVKDLTAEVEFKYLGADSTYRAEEYFAYAISGITPYVWAFETSLTGDAPKTWGGEVGASYAMTGVTPSVYFDYNSDASYAFGAAAAFTVEKNAIRVYADYQSAATFDLGFRYVVSF